MIHLKQQHLGALLVLLSATGFATLAIFIKIAYSAGANTLTVLTLRFMLASLLLWMALKPLGISPRISGRAAVQLGLMGTIGYGSMSFFFASSLQYLSASLSEMLLFTYPALVSLLSFALGFEKFSWQKGLALATCLYGLFLILGVSLGNISHIGIALALGSAIIYSCYIMISNHVLKDVHSLVATTYVCSATALAFHIYLEHWATYSILTTNGLAIPTWNCIFRNNCWYFMFLLVSFALELPMLLSLVLLNRLLQWSYLYYFLADTFPCFRVGGLLIVASILILQVYGAKAPS